MAQTHICTIELKNGTMAEELVSVLLEQGATKGDEATTIIANKDGSIEVELPTTAFHYTITPEGDTSRQTGASK